MVEKYNPKFRRVTPGIYSTCRKFSTVYNNKILIGDL